MFTMPDDVVPTADGFNGDNRSPVMVALDTWRDAQQVAINAKAAEMAARQLLVALAFPSPVEGTMHHDLGDDYSLKASFKNNYSLDNKEVEAMLKKLPKAISANLVSWKADLSVKAYKALEPAHKAIVNTVLTIKPATPSLEVIEPKVK